MNKKYFILSTILQEKNNAPSLREKAFFEYLKNNKYNIEFIGIEKDEGLVKNISYIYRRTNEVLKESKFENIILFRNIFLSPLILILKIKYRLKVIQDFHGYYYLELLQNKKYFKVFVSYLFDKLSNFISDKIISVSRGISHSQIKKYGHKTIMIPNGIDKTKLSAVLKNNGFRLKAKNLFIKHKNIYNIGFCGNAGNWFNIEYVINELKTLNDVTFFIIGTGYNYDFLKQKVIKENINNIIFLGVLENNITMNLLNYMDFLITPYNKKHRLSNIKNFFSSKKNREYIYLKKPILTPNIPGLDYLFNDKKGIVLYDDGVDGSLHKSFNYIKNESNCSLKTNELTLMQDEIDINYIISKSGVFLD